MKEVKQTFAIYWDSIVTKLPDLVEGAIVMILFVLLARFVKGLVGKKLEKRTEDKLRARFITRVLSSSIILLGLMLAMKAAGYGEVAAGLLAGAGVSAFIVGFALKDIGENFLAGFLLSFSRPFRVNDTIEVNGIKGVVKTLNLRNTQVKSFEGIDIFIPNATLIKNPLQNYTLDGYLRKEFVIGVDYGTDFAKARKTLEGVLKKNQYVAKDHSNSMVVHDSLGSSTYNIKVQYWEDMFDSSITSADLKTILVEDCIAALNDGGVQMPGDILELRPTPKLVPVQNV